jgi:hypothetical protein
MKNTGNILLLFICLFVFTACQNEGCMDMDAANYNANAGKNDGLCRYRYLSSVIVNKIPLIDSVARTQIEWDDYFEESYPDIKFYLKITDSQSWEFETNIQKNNGSYPFMWKIDILKGHYLRWNQTYKFLLADEDFVGMDTIFIGTFTPSKIYKDDKIILRNRGETAEIELDFVVY